MLYFNHYQCRKYPLHCNEFVLFEVRNRTAYIITMSIAYLLFKSTDLLLYCKPLGESVTQQSRPIDFLSWRLPFTLRQFRGCSRDGVSSTICSSSTSSSSESAERATDTVGLVCDSDSVSVLGCLALLLLVPHRALTVCCNCSAVNWFGGHRHLFPAQYFRERTLKNTLLLSDDWSRSALYNMRPLAIGSQNNFQKNCRNTAVTTWHTKTTDHQIIKA